MKFKCDYHIHTRHSNDASPEAAKALLCSHDYEFVIGSVHTTPKMSANMWTRHSK